MAITCIPPGPVAGVADKLNALLKNGGPSYKLNLCPNTTYVLHAPLLFTAPYQEISTLGYPKGSTRAVLLVDGLRYLILIRSRAELSHLTFAPIGIQMEQGTLLRSRASVVNAEVSNFGMSRSMETVVQHGRRPLEVQISKWEVHPLTRLWNT